MITMNQTYPCAWMTEESARRLVDGGNCKGAVPVHSKRSTTAKIPMYDQAEINAAVAAERERCAAVCKGYAIRHAANDDDNTKAQAWMMLQCSAEILKA